MSNNADLALLDYRVIPRLHSPDSELIRATLRLPAPGIPLPTRSPVAAAERYTVSEPKRVVFAGSIDSVRTVDFESGEPGKAWDVSGFLGKETHFSRRVL